MTDATKTLRDLTGQLRRIDAKCAGIQRFNPDHLTTTHYQCERQREDIEREIVYWRNQADEAMVR